jgi:dihydroorotase
MKILIPSSKIVDTNSPYNGQQKSILIEDGIITQIADKIDFIKDSSSHQTPSGMHVSPGWLDMHSNMRDPGYEYQEDVNSGIQAALAGGFTGVAVMPCTMPVLQSKSEIEYLINKSRHALVDIYPIGALTHNMEGKELTEMFDMTQSGAVAFSDEKKSVMDAGVLLRALLYVKNFNGLIISFADDRNISGNGVMHEGINNTLLGLKGIPALSEEIMIQRDIALTAYTESKIHFATISSARSVELIRKAKANGIKITAEICAHQLAFDDSCMTTFDANYKVKPPFRSREDIDALKQGLADGTIDAICSDHSPHNSEKKIREFEHAAFGIIGHETAFAIANTHLKNLMSLNDLINKFVARPREILNIQVPQIKIGMAANLTIFDPELDWIFSESQIKSKSKNTPFAGVSFKGKPIAVVNKGQFALC